MGRGFSAAMRPYKNDEWGYELVISRLIAAACLSSRQAAALTLALSYAASSAAESANFNIDAQPLPSAVKAFIEQSHLQLLYRYESLQGAMGNAVHGNQDKRAALEQLLRNSGLEAVFSSDNAAAILPGRAAARSASGRSDPAARGGQSATASCTELVSCAEALPPPPVSLSELDEVIVTA